MPDVFEVRWRFGFGTRHEAGSLLYGYVHRPGRETPSMAVMVVTHEDVSSFRFVIASPSHGEHLVVAARVDEGDVLDVEWLERCGERKDIDVAAVARAIDVALEGESDD